MNVDDVIAHAVYDPVARRERYLAKRKLKGRRLVAGPPKAGQGSRIVDANAPGSTVHVSKAHADAVARQKASDARQISAIRGRLNGLKSHLQELLAKKKQEATKSKSSSSSKTSTSSSKSTKAGGGNDKPKTAKQQQAAKESLKKAQEARAKEQKATPDKKKAPDLTLDEQITRTRAVITDVELKLRTAIEQSRTQTASNGR